MSQQARGGSGKPNFASYKKAGASKSTKKGAKQKTARIAAGKKAKREAIQKGSR